MVSMGQVFERGAYRLVYFDDAGITSSSDFEAKTIGLWGGFQQQISATFGKNGLDIDSDAEVFNQGFDMLAFLDGTIDLASAMTYNEYAQALAGNESDREILLFDPNEEGTATLEDTLTTTETWLADNPEAAEKFIRATAKGWIYWPGQRRVVHRHRAGERHGPAPRLPDLADERGQQADLALHQRGVQHHR